MTVRAPTNFDDLWTAEANLLHAREPVLSRDPSSTIDNQMLTVIKDELVLSDSFGCAVISAGALNTWYDIRKWIVYWPNHGGYAGHALLGCEWTVFARQISSAGGIAWNVRLDINGSNVFFTMGAPLTTFAWRGSAGTAATPWNSGPSIPGDGTEAVITLAARQTAGALSTFAVAGIGIYTDGLPA